MPRNIHGKHIHNALKKGVVKAFREYTAMSGHSGLADAPEGWVKACIAQVLAKSMNVENGGWVVLEISVQTILEDAGAIRRGRKSDGLRHNGRYDMAVYFKGKGPRAVVEVKHPVWSYSNIVKDDIKRIRDTLRLCNETDSKLKDGYFVFYTGVDKPKNKSLNEALYEKIHKIAGKALSDLGGNFSCKPYLTKPRIVVNRETRDWAWAAVVLHCKIIR